jgi:hypothetical protein
MLLEDRFQLPYHRGPVALGLLFVRELWQVHDMYRFQVTNKLKHLLFPITCRLRNDNIRKAVERAGIGGDETITGFDQRAKVAGQGNFGGSDHLV